jgi:hypothetical protein
MIEWRERRLTTYESAANAIHRLLGVADVAATDPSALRDAIGDSALECFQARTELQKALDRCHLVGTGSTRAAALQVDEAAARLGDSIDDLAAHASDDPGPFDELFDAGQRFRERVEAWQAAVRAELGVPDPSRSPPPPAPEG